MPIIEPSEIDKCQENASFFTKKAPKSTKERCQQQIIVLLQSNLLTKGRSVKPDGWSSISSYGSVFAHQEAQEVYEKVEMRTSLNWIG